MQEQIITFETAKLVKEKGFNIPVIKYYTPKGYCSESEGYQTERLEESNWNNGMGSYPTLSKDVCCSAPTQSLLQKWLREVHQLYVEVQVDQTTYPKFHFEVTRFIGNPKDLSEREWGWESKYHAEYLYRTYEEALEEGLQIALKLI